MIRYVDRRGNEISMPEWMGLFSTDDYRQLQHTKVNGYSISTVWTGMVWSNSGGPFETQLVGPDVGAVYFRYETEREAIADHTRLVEEASGRPHIIPGN